MNHNGLFKVLFFIKKKLLKKQRVNRNKKLSLVYHYSVIQTNKLFTFRNLTTKCIGGQIKAFGVLFYIASDGKSTKSRER